MDPYSRKGGATIYHGDCAEVVGDLDPVDLVLTDPPYGFGRAKLEWRATAAVAIGLHATARKVRKGGSMLVFTTSSARGIEFTLGAVGKVLPFNRVLTWHKSFVRSQVAGPWRWDTVQILCFGRCSFGRPQHSSVFTSSGPTCKRALGETKHPAELPDGLGDWLWGPFNGIAGSVLDPFVGSGQLLLPPLRDGATVIGVDVSGEWAELAASRLGREGTPCP